MLETVKLVTQSLNAPRESRLLDTRRPTDSCRKHWEKAPFLARLVVMRRWNSLSWPTFPPVMAMGKITGWWEMSKGKGKPLPSSVLTGEWQVKPAAGAEPLSEEDVTPPLDHSVDGAVTSYSDTPMKEVGSCLVNPLPYWLSVPLGSTPISQPQKHVTSMEF